MRESLVSLLKVHRDQLTNITIDENFWSRLVDYGALTSEHTNLCKAKTTNVEKLEHLLDLMERRDDSCFQKFSEALRCTNPGIVERCLEDLPLQMQSQPETDEFSGVNIEAYLDSLHKKNVELLTRWNKEYAAYNDLESVNTKLQKQLEAAENKVVERKKEHEANEDKYVKNKEELDSEKILITSLDNEIQELEAGVANLEDLLNEERQSRKGLEEELKAKTQENDKFRKQISFYRTSLSSLGSKSFNEST